MRFSNYKFFNLAFLSRINIAIIQTGLLISILLLLVSSCTVTPLSQEKKSPEKKEITAHNRQYDVWRINGRISFVNEQENWYAKFNWIQQKDDFQISFTGPLGETELQISQIDKHILLKTPSGEMSSDDLEQLLFQETGWKFPVTSLRYWSQGYPDPNIAAQVKYNEQQQISDIFQAGWHIQYPKRMEVAQTSGLNVVLPKKIIATEQNVKIKLIITSWHLGES